MVGDDLARDVDEVVSVGVLGFEFGARIEQRSQRCLELRHVVVGRAGRPGAEGVLRFEVRPRAQDRFVAPELEARAGRVGGAQNRRPRVARLIEPRPVAPIRVPTHPLLEIQRTLGGGTPIHLGHQIQHDRVLMRRLHQHAEAVEGPA